MGAIAIGRRIVIALTDAQVATLPTIRYVTGESFQPCSPGKALVELRPGDVIGDASTIEAIQAAVPGTPDFPNPSGVLYEWCSPTASVAE